MPFSITTTYCDQTVSVSLFVTDSFYNSKKNHLYIFHCFSSSFFLSSHFSNIKSQGLVQKTRDVLSGDFSKYSTPKLNVDFLTDWSSKCQPKNNYCDTLHLNVFYSFCSDKLGRICYEYVPFVHYIHS